jgi:hypothetical protein
MLTSLPVSSLPGIEMTEYYVQKKALEEAVSQLRNFRSGPKICLVKPGAVATQSGQTAPKPFADVNEWAKQLIAILDAGPNLEVSDISLGVNYG